MLMKKLVSILLAITLVFGGLVTAVAADGEEEQEGAISGVQDNAAGESGEEVMDEAEVVEEAIFDEEVIEEPAGEEAAEEKTEAEPEEETSEETVGAEEPVEEEIPAEQEEDENAEDEDELPASNAGIDAESGTLMKPSILSLSQKNDRIMVHWKAVSGARQYQISAKFGTGSWRIVGTVSGSKTWFTHWTSATPKKSGFYVHYRVRAVGAGGVKGSYCASHKIYRLASPGPVTLSQAKAEDKVYVSWTKVTGAQYYHICYRVSGASKYKIKTVGGSKSTASIPVTGTKNHDVFVMAETNDFYSQRSVIKHIRPYWYRVLLVGEYDYYDGNDDLPGGKYDLSGMGTLFRSQTNKVTSLANVSASTILSNVASTFGGCSPNTVCVFLFSGHGSTGYGSSSGKLCCVDGSSIYPSTLKLYMDYYCGNNNIVLLGSCGSGGFIDPNGQEKSDLDPNKFCSDFISAFKSPDANAGEFRDRDYTVIAAAAAHTTGTSWSRWRYYEWNVINGGSEIFMALGKAGGYNYFDKNVSGTGFVGWTKMWGDSNKDKEVTVKEAYQYARWHVPSSTVQFWSERSGLVLFQ